MNFNLDFVMDHNYLMLPPAKPQYIWDWNQLDVIYATDRELVQSLLNSNLLVPNPKCGRCGSQMKLRKRSKALDGLEWRCRHSKSKDCSTRSIKTGSKWFELSKLSLRKIIVLVKMFVEDSSCSTAADMLNISKSTFVEYRNHCRDVCARINESPYCNRSVAEADANSLDLTSVAVLDAMKKAKGRNEDKLESYVSEGVARVKCQGQLEKIFWQVIQEDVTVE